STVSLSCASVTAGPARPTLFPYTTLFRSQSVILRRADAGARERDREDPTGHAARSCRADRLRRHHRLWRGGQHRAGDGRRDGGRSEEHTSELQSHLKLVCRLLLEKKKNNR